MIWLLVVWLVCFIYSFGTAMAYQLYQGRPYGETSRDELGFCVAVSLFGPISVIVAGLWCNFNQHGWMLWRRGGGE